MFSWKQNDLAVMAWRQALEMSQASERVEIGEWMARHLPAFDRQLTESLVHETENYLPQLMTLNSALAWSLVRCQSWLVADKILSKAASRNANLLAAWAEVALSMSDFTMASSRARAAFQQGDPNWSRDWYDKFQQRLNVAMASR